MKLNLLTTVLLSLLSAPLALTAPVIVNGVESVGAAYTMTNQPSGNFLVVLSVGIDGTLSYVNAIPTGGVGSRGLTSAIGDATHGQGAIQVHYGKKLLVVPNLGSSTLTLLRVDPNNPLKVTKIGNPVPSGGDFPNSVIFNKAGDRLCASNIGTRDGFMCFVVNTDVGLIPIPDSFRPYGLNQTVPPTGPANTATQIGFSPDEKKIYVTSKGSIELNSEGFLATWDVDLKRDDTVSIAQASDKIIADIAGLRPFGWTYVNGRNAIIVAESFIGIDIFDLDKNTVAFTSVPNNGAHCWTVYSNKTDRYYITSLFSGTISEIEIDNKQEILKPAVTTQYHKNGFLSDAVVLDIGDKGYLMTISSGPGPKPTTSAPATIYVDTPTSIYVDYLRGPGDAVPVQKFDLTIIDRIAGIPIDQNHTNGLAVFLNTRYAPVPLS